MTAHVFAGPTLSASQIRAVDGDARVHPPVVHGDLLRLVLCASDIVVIIDGGYHQTGSVRHKEVLSLLAAGVRVVGCSSMGALRAAELMPYGMIGNGAVFEMYRDGVIEADDEVAVAHGDGPEYKRFSEPLVNIRTALAAASRAGIVTAPEATAIVEFAQAQPYTARTWQGIERGTQGMGAVPQAVGRVRTFLAEHPEHANIKAADALDTLSRLGEITAQPGAHDMTWSRSPHWKHRYLYEWTANFAGCWVDDVRVEFGSIIRYRQIYDRDFPRRWRAFALRQMLSANGASVGDLTMEQVEDRMASLAAEKGLDGASLTAEQAGEWLLEDVERDLPARERLCRVLARSFRPARGIHDLLTAEPDLVRDDGARRAVAESYVVNTTIDGWGPRHSVHHIKRSLLRNHLAEVWQPRSNDDRALTVAARDRGFPSLQQAEAAVRPFYLRHHVRAATCQSGRTRSGAP